MKLLCVFSFWLVLLISDIPVGNTIQFDIVVYGGTAAGIVSAIQAAKMNKRVALIEPSAHIGGMSVEGLGGSDIDNHKEFANSAAIGGLSLEFYRRISKVVYKNFTLKYRSILGKDVRNLIAILSDNVLCF